MNIDFIVLAGGRSRRMGSDKAVLKLGEKSLLQWALALAEANSGKVVVAGPVRQGIKARYVPDIPGFPPSSLLGLASALQTAAGEWQLAIGCDMPFVRPELVRLLARSCNAGGAVAMWHNRIQPLPLLLPRAKALPLSLELLEAGRFHLAALLDRLEPAVVPAEEVARMDKSGLSFFNINSRDDLDTARKIMERELLSRNR